MPTQRGLYYGGAWHQPKAGVYLKTINPTYNEAITTAPVADADDVDAAVRSAHAAFPAWAATPPVERGRYLRRAAAVLREHALPLAQLDSLNNGNPVSALAMDAGFAADCLGYFAGLATEIKGETIPMGDGNFNYTPQEPLGVIARIVAYNHPFMFAAARLAAPLAAGNTVVVKSFDQAPLSILRLANSLAIFSRLASPISSAAGAHAATSWAGMLEKVVTLLPERHKPGIPTDPKTTMGSLVSRAQLEKVKGYVAAGLEDGGRLVCGGKQPDDPVLKDGFFYEATVFADMQPHMRLAQEEVFGPIMSVFKWSDEDTLWEQVNGVDVGLTGSIWTQNLNIAHRAAKRIHTGYVWINNASQHFMGARFGSVKQSGIGREECFAELLEFTYTKNVNLKLG